MINQQQIDAIVAFVEQSGLDDGVVSQLRQDYPGCHFTYCMDEDVHFPKAYAERRQFNVYLVDSREHCSTLTTVSEVASGMVLAAVTD